MDQRPDRCHAAGIPDQVGFATKPALATQMLTRALAAGVPAGWVAGDEVYGADPVLRTELEDRQVGDVLAVACDHRVHRVRLDAGGRTQRADALVGQVPARAWQQVSCGMGAKGHRFYDGAFIRLHHHDQAEAEAGAEAEAEAEAEAGAEAEAEAEAEAGAGRHWLMIRRNRKTGELAFYRCSTPQPTPLATLVKVAGTRWTIAGPLMDH